MGTAEAISPRVATLSIPEAQALADRLMSRSLSTLFAASPQVRHDLLTASRAIRSLLHEYDRVASRLEDEAYRLRSLRIDVGGC
jgi:hypothetical protein